MQVADLQLNYHAGQADIFFNCKSRFRIVTKGRRWGFTQGAAQFIIEKMLDGVTPIMWGDTITANINKYVERYFIPVLKNLPSEIWDWKKQEKVLYIKDAVCDFRSADQPENWEGFGYKIIILNEAGIILKNQYLWHNAVRPMLMDYPDSIAIIGGTPKGKNLFYELSQKGISSNDDWGHFQFSSYSNPFLSKKEIDDLCTELPESIARQEIFAEFTDEGESVLIPYNLIVECMGRETVIDSPQAQEIWGVDVARHGSDFSVIAKRRWKNVHEIKTYSVADTMQLASSISYEFSQAKVKPVKVFVETTGMGWGVYDRLRELRVPVYPADVGLRSEMPKTLNKRIEMYVRLYQAMQSGLKLPDDKKLLRQLSNTFIEYDDKGNLKLIAKEKIKSDIGESPDVSDAVALTYFEDVAIVKHKPVMHNRQLSPLAA